MSLSENAVRVHYGKMLGRKTRDILLVCNKPIDERREAWDLLCERYSEKAVIANILNHPQLFTYGVSPRYAWLTDFGKEVFEGIKHL